MPALITHYLFGEEALNRGACPGVVDPAEGHSVCRIAFDLGCQGPDPFFFGYTTLRGTEVRGLARAMHTGKVLESFEALRHGVGMLPARDRAVGTALACGLLAHYVLDKTAHPYVFALEEELCGSSPELADARHEVHAVIESEIDCGVLDHYRGCSTAQFAPVSVLDKDPQATRVAGKLFSDVGRGLYGLQVRPGDYAGALDDMRTCYRLIEPHGSRRSRSVGALERKLRTHSQLESLAHRADVRAGNPSMNPAGRTWTDPFTQTASQESFVEVFERALAEYPLVAKGFLDGEPLRGLVGKLDYNGREQQA